MPEIAEVETMRRGFERHIDKHLDTLFIRAKDQLGDINRVPNLTYDQKVLKSSSINGATLKSVKRRGKNIIANWEGRRLESWDAVISPRMTGHLVWSTETKRVQPLPFYQAYGTNQPSLYAAAVTRKYHPTALFGFVFDDGVVEFRDVRKFGHIWLVNSWLELEHLRNLGRDLLDDECDLAYLLSRVDQYVKVSPRARVKPFLLDQRQVAGIGNYMASEILFAAEVRPDRMLADLTTLDWQRILSYAKNLASLMISVGGVSLRDYNTFDGTPGGGQRLLQVYGKDSCPLGHPVSRVKLASRVTYYCEECQK